MLISHAHATSFCIGKNTRSNWICWSTKANNWVNEWKRMRKSERKSTSIHFYLTLLFRKRVEVFYRHFFLSSSSFLFNAKEVLRSLYLYVHQKKLKSKYLLFAPFTNKWNGNSYEKNKQKRTEKITATNFKWDNNNTKKTLKIKLNQCKRNCWV